MANARRDDNYVPTLIGVSSSDNNIPELLEVDPLTGRLLVNSTVTGSITVIGIDALTNGSQKTQIIDGSGNVVESLQGGGGEQSLAVVVTNGELPVNVTNTPTVEIIDFGLPSSSTVTTVSDTATSTTIKASNSDRKEIEIVNTSSAVLYILKGSGTASSTNFTARLEQYDYYTTNYRGQVNGVWATDPNDGSAIITEST